MNNAANEELHPVQPDDEPDVLLDVSELRVDEVSLEVDDLRARVSLDANVLELLKLHVGVDAELGRVQLTIKGVEAKVLLKVRLDNVARILDRVLDTIDKNPDIIEHLTTRIGQAAEGVGTDAGRAVGELGTGAGSAVGEVVETAGTAVGETVDEVGRAAGQTVDDVAEEERQQRPKVRKSARQTRERAADGRGRRTSADPAKKRSAKGSRTSRPRRSKED
jgi:hypothetical protein